MTPKDQQQSILKRHESNSTVLRFTPTAWAKLLFFRDYDETEITGFGISAADDLLLIEDFVTIKQEVSVVSVSMEDQAIANYFEDQVDAGRKPEQFGRLWIHSHPGNSPIPSSTDESTFQRVFGHCQWSVMFIIARDGSSYARLRFNVGPGGQAVIPVEVDYSSPFSQSDLEAWELEYKSNIKPITWPDSVNRHMEVVSGDDLYGSSCPDYWLDELEAMEPQERQLILDELASRPDLWDQEKEVADEHC